jgi:hypothetical protein
MKQRELLWLALGAAAAALGCGDEERGCDPTTPGVLCTIVGAGDGQHNGYSGDDGPALEAMLSFPQDTLTASDGSMYLLDWNNHRIRKVVDGIIHHVAGRGELGGSLDDPANGDFNHPTGILFTPDESRLLIAAWHNSKVRTLDLASGEIVDTCGDGRRAYWGDNGPATSSSLDLPTSITWDPQGNLVIMDQANQVLRTVDGSGNIHTLYGQCVIDAPPPSGPGACGDAVSPSACAAMGNSASGKNTCGDPALTCVNPCTPGYNGDDVAAATMRIAQPLGQSADPGGRMAYDANGSLYFADSGNSLIRRIDPDGMVHRIAGLAPVNGIAQRGYSGDGGPASEAELNNPVDLAFGPDGTLFFTDTYNNCVRSIDSEGNIATVVGQCGVLGDAGDGGPPEQALLRRPYGIELVGKTLIISDTGNNRIRSVRLYY